MNRHFQPCLNGTVVFSVTSSAQNADIAMGSTYANSLWIENTGNQPAWIRMGSSPQNAATMADTVIAAGRGVIINRPMSVQNVGYVCSPTATTTLYCTTGYSN